MTVKWQIEEPKQLVASYLGGRKTPEEHFGECRAIVDEDVELVARHRKGPADAYGVLVRLSAYDELLAACKAAQAEIAEVVDSGLCDVVGEREVLPIERQLRAAIAKAEANP